MKQGAYLAAGVLLGALLLAGARFAFVHEAQPVHYHANFAVFVDGERLDLSGDEYMEEVTHCNAGAGMSPTERVHLHDNVPDVVHVHHDGVTWGHLFYNLGMTLGQRSITTRDGTLYRAGEGGALRFVLNGRPELSVHNTPIRSGDRLVVSYGAASEAEVLQREYPQVPANAEEYNHRPDPAGCAGAHRRTVGDRLRHAFTG
jgi:hypothetical protein